MKDTHRIVQNMEGKDEEEKEKFMGILRYNFCFTLHIGEEWVS